MSAMHTATTDNLRKLDDDRRIACVREQIISRVPRDQTLDSFFGSVIRRAIDDILMLRPHQFRINQLSAPEQTYIGTRVEILTKEGLDLGTGLHADALVGDDEVDLKWSKSLSWMIGPENLGLICLGIGTNKTQSAFSVGLFVPHRDQLGGQNRDQKYSASPKYRQAHVTWLIQDAPLPPNFIEGLPNHIRDDIMSRQSAQERIKRLAELVPNTPIPRNAIRFVSLNKDDFMRRIREDRSRRTPPLGQMVCLSWKYKKAELARLGISLKRDEFVFVDRNRIRAPGIKPQGSGDSDLTLIR